MSGGKTDKTTALICASISHSSLMGSFLNCRADLKTAEESSLRSSEGALIRVSRSLRHLMKEGKEFYFLEQVLEPGESMYQVVTANIVVSLASVSVRDAICDEVAKYPDMAGDEAVRTELETVRINAHHRGTAGKSLICVNFLLMSTKVR